MIPKIIHYVWLGKSEKPTLIKRCISSWRKNLHDFEFKEWNEDNFPIRDNKFTRTAYENKKYAFVSDYIRASVIEQFGGIYIDTDVMMLENLNSLLVNNCFVGFEKNNQPFSAVFGSVAHHPLMQDMKRLYVDQDFDVNNMNALINTDSVSKLLIDKYHCIPNGEEQIIDEGIHVYPNSILCDPSSQSLAIHIRNGSWVPGNRNITAQIGVRLRSHITTKRQAGIYAKVKKIQNKLKGR